jgi:3-hydroxyacyl-CoA dehydrogenase/enoyl-CoA hydratase/3-hydroxybutyryl-CoA epimerase
MRYLDVQQDNGVAVIWLDQPGEKVNKLTRAFQLELSEVLDALEADPEVRALVFISRKPESFIVGADIAMLAELKTRAEAKNLVREGHALLQRLEAFPKPTVAAMHGAVAGGGLELALACSYRLASEHPKTKLSLPEVKLGLLPGLGGTQRLPRRIGLPQALTLLLSGKNVYPKRARKLGLIGATIHPYGLLEAAGRAARELAEGTRKPEPKRGHLWERTLLSLPVYRQAEARIKRRGGSYPAPYRVLEVVRTGLERGLGAGLEAEAAAFAELLFTPQFRALAHLFFAQEAARKNPFQGARKVKTVGVLGAGLMGAGIAEISARGGYEVLLKDRELGIAARGKKVIWQDLTERLGKGLSAFERDQLVERVTPLESYAPFTRADLVIEAVLEEIQVKQQVLREVEATGKESLIFASNTSSIPIRELAQISRRPEQVIGMHYFSPAQKMPLLEIIRTEQAPEWVLATAYAAGLKQGKTPIVVRDAPGFYVNRILAPYLDEALTLLAEGARIEAVDKAMVRFGFPVGPLKLLDEVGLDVSTKVTGVLAPFFAARGQRLTEVGQALKEAGLVGRKGGRGFYTYTAGRSAVNADIYRFFGASRREVAAETIQQRLLLALVNEAVCCLEEGVLASPRDGDVGAVFGLGFPPFLGGPFWYSDSRGAEDTVARLRGLEADRGARFKPAALLQQQAEEGGKFYPA